MGPTYQSEVQRYEQDSQVSLEPFAKLLCCAAQDIQNQDVQSQDERILKEHWV